MYFNIQERKNIIKNDKYLCLYFNVFREYIFLFIYQNLIRQKVSTPVNVASMSRQNFYIKKIIIPFALKI